MVKYNDAHIDDIFHALSDRRRRRILQMVARRSRSASELAGLFHISFPAVSKHLKVLERAKLIRRTVHGRVHSFNFEERTLKKAYRWIKFYEKFWLYNLEGLETYLSTQKKKEK